MFGIEACLGRICHWFAVVGCAVMPCALLTDGGGRAGCDSHDPPTIEHHGDGHGAESTGESTWARAARGLGDVPGDGACGWKATECVGVRVQGRE